MKKTVIVMVVIIVGLIASGCGSDDKSSSGSDNACDNLVMDCSKCTDDLAKEGCTTLVSGLKSRNNSDECKEYNDLWASGKYDGSTMCQ